MSQKPRMKFLVAIWGDQYVEEFARVSMPSYLAAGNIPALAAGADLEMLVMTTRGSRAKFDEEPIFNRVREFCPIRFIYIDDLIATGIYGVTLTLAFARGIRDSGDRQTETTFIFMNSDFILADGALATLRKKIDAGARCVMAPSLRANSEAVLPLLSAATDAGNGVLSMSAREMVKLAFDHLHATVIGKTVTQHMFTCATHNQIYWQVDSTSLLARYHLIFMLAIKPERPLPPINSYCDYGFVPEMVPSGAFTILNDSDEFFMLEIQSTDQEKSLIRIGHSTPSSIASELSIWSTKEHRAFAGIEVHFHTGDAPAHAVEEGKKLDRYMDAIFGQMGKPIDHVEHFYWSLGYQAWKSLNPRLRGREGNDPPEITGAEFVAASGRASSTGCTGPTDTGALEALHAVDETEDAAGVGAVPLRRPRRLSFPSVANFYKALLTKGIGLMSRRPNVPVWHHQWPDFQLLIKSVERLRDSAIGATLVVCQPDSPFIPYFTDQPGFSVHEGFDDLESISDGAEGTYKHLLLHISRSDMRRIHELLSTLEKVFAPDADIRVFVEPQKSEDDPTDFSNEFPQYIDQMLPPFWRGYDIRAIYAGGRLKRILRNIERRLFGWLVPSSMARLPLLFFAAGFWPVVAVCTVLNNLRIRAQGDTCPPFCSSFLMTLTPIRAAYRSQGASG